MVPDPASRGQAPDVDDASVVHAKDYPWQHGDWTGRPWTDVVLYELHAGVAGGFAGIQDDLPRLKTLGITAIELMPVNDFPAVGTGVTTAFCPMRRTRPMAPPMS